MSQLFRKQVDNMMDAYVGWHEACRLVNDAYSSWSSATGLRARVAFLRYMAALDAEERAAGVYAGTVRRVGRLVMSGHDAGGPLGAPPWGARWPGPLVRRRQHGPCFRVLPGGGTRLRVRFSGGGSLGALQGGTRERSTSTGLSRTCWSGRIAPAAGRPPRATLDAAI